LICSHQKELSEFPERFCIIAKSQRFINELDPNPAWVVKWIEFCRGLCWTILEPTVQDWQEDDSIYEIIFIPELSDSALHSRAIW